LLITNGIIITHRSNFTHSHIFLTSTLASTIQTNQFQKNSIQFLQKTQIFIKTAFNFFATYLRSTSRVFIFPCVRCLLAGTAEPIDVSPAELEVY